MTNAAYCWIHRNGKPVAFIVHAHVPKPAVLHILKQQTRIKVGRIVDLHEILFEYAVVSDANYFLDVDPRTPDAIPVTIVYWDQKDRAEKCQAFQSPLVTELSKNFPCGLTRTNRGYN